MDQCHGAPRGTPSVGRTSAREPGESRKLHSDAVDFVGDVLDNKYTLVSVLGGNDAKQERVYMVTTEPPTETALFAKEFTLTGLPRPVYEQRRNRMRRFAKGPRTVLCSVDHHDKKLLVFTVTTPRSSGESASEGTTAGSDDTTSCRAETEASQGGSRTESDAGPSGTKGPGGDAPSRSNQAPSRRRRNRQGRNRPEVDSLSILALGHPLYLDSGAGDDQNLILYRRPIGWVMDNDNVDNLQAMQVAFLASLRAAIPESIESGGLEAEGDDEEYARVLQEGIWQSIKRPLHPGDHP